MIVDKNIRFSDLKGILEDFLHDMFGADTRVVSVPAISRLQNRARKWIFPVSCAAEKDAGSALIQAGWKSWAAA